IGLLVSNCSSSKQEQQLTSPDKTITVNFSLNDGTPCYSVNHNEEQIILPSSLGFTVQDREKIFEKFKIDAVVRHSLDDTWEMVWGENKRIRNHYNEMKISLVSQADKNFGMDIFFRAFDDGIGFRYELKGTQGDSIKVISENSEFNLAGDYLTWWIPQDFDSYERNYEVTDYEKVVAVNTPITFKSKTGHRHLCIHEAALTDYAGMTLIKVDKGLKSALVPWPDGIKVKSTYPMLTPWRTVQISNDAAGLIESDMILNLNVPNKLDDTSWITTGKYVGIWWSMHLNKHTWFAGPNHGATTENAKAYIDFAAQHDISGLLIEGWNIGWEGFGSRETAQNYTTPYDDIDYEEVVAYGKKHGVNIIGHHETAANVSNYIDQMEDAFDYYERLGIQLIKTGYVGEIIPKGQHHHGQWMVNHYRDVVKMAADHKIMINAHEPIKPTGIRRTYPNMMTREGAMGMEYNAWSEGLSPQHTVILPFTRLLGGPMDFTPGIFDITFDRYKKDFRVYTTLAKQLSYYINIYSPWQMAADLIENYEGHQAFDFIDAVYTDWDESKVLTAAVGDYLVMARRKGDEWFIGATTDELGRDFKIDLKFLEDDTKYIAHIFADAVLTNWKTSPTEIEIGKYLVTGQDHIHAVLSPSGGQAIHIYPYKSGTYSPIDEFNQTAGERAKAFKEVPIYEY
ncbi:MAG: glycoside hydrolase family 97 protein, partial [Fidelibacterota bacterium]